MVIQKFNKLIRNKWIWGVFAVAISAFFAFDFLIADLNAPSERGGGSGAGTIAGEKVDAALFEALADDVRGIGRNRDWKTDQSEVNRAAWENYAALLVAERALPGQTADLCQNLPFQVTDSLVVRNHCHLRFSFCP